MTTRARISNGSLNEYETLIARMVHIQEETRALGLDLDIDTLAYVHRRLTSIIEAAGKTKAQLIERMEAEKQAAREGRL